MDREKTEKTIRKKERGNDQHIAKNGARKAQGTACKTKVNEMEVLTGKLGFVTSKTASWKSWINPSNRYVTESATRGTKEGGTNLEEGHPSHLRKEQLLVGPIELKCGVCRVSPRIIHIHSLAPGIGSGMWSGGGRAIYCGNRGRSVAFAGGYHSAQGKWMLIDGTDMPSRP